MAKPLSVWKYYCNNQKKVALVLAIVFLSAFLQCALLVYIATWLKFAYALEPFRSNIYVGAQKSKQSQLQQLLSTNPAIAKIFPLGLGAVGTSKGQAFSLWLYPKDMKPVMHSLGLTLIKGRLPAAGTSEIAIHWRLAALIGLKIGDHYGRRRSYKLVGLLDGDYIVGFSDLNTYFHLSKQDTGFLIIPRKDQWERVASFLAECKRKDPKLFIFYRGPYIKNDLLVLNALYLAITCIVTICVSFLFYIYFYQRRPEMCLLEALGYTRNMIIGRAFFEISDIVLAGFILGLTVGLLSGQALNDAVFVKQGLPLELWGISYLVKLLSTPLAIILSGLLIVWRMLKKADPISTIEGEV